MMLDLEKVSRDRQAVLEQAVHFFKAMPSVVGVFLVGSLANHTEDAYSDIDLRVIGGANQFNDLISNRVAYPKNFGVLLFNEITPVSPRVCVSHFEPFIKLDVLYLRPQDLEPSPIYRSAIRVFHDPQNLIQRLLDASRQLQPMLHGEAYNHMFNKIFAYAHEIYRRMMRHETIYAQSLLMTLKGFAAAT
jgi:predicted nucleotidyltransferase